MMTLDGLRPETGLDSDDFSARRRHCPSGLSDGAGHDRAGVGVDDEKLHGQEGGGYARRLCARETLLCIQKKASCAKTVIRAPD